MKLKSIAAHILDLAFPPKCVFCRRIINRVDNGTCPKCAKELPYTFGKEVFVKTEFVSAAAAPFFYRDNVREAVLRFKFGGKESYAEAFGEYMAYCAGENLPLPELITWVPVSKKRRRERGYDQAQLLAEAVSRRIGVPVVHLLKKTVNNPAQTSIRDREVRKANVLGVYDIADPSAAAGKNILLVDDVITTGATTSECARMLLTAGAQNVYLVAFARR